MNKVNKVGAFVEYFFMIICAAFSGGFFVQSIFELNHSNYFFMLFCLFASIVAMFLSFAFYVGWKNISSQKNKTLDEERKLHED